MWQVLTARYRQNSTRSKASFEGSILLLAALHSSPANSQQQKQL
jgi:hypothetical protein